MAIVAGIASAAETLNNLEDNNDYDNDSERQLINQRSRMDSKLSLVYDASFTHPDRNDELLGNEPVIRVNVGGMKFRFATSSLKSLPESLLGKIAQLNTEGDIARFAPCHSYDLRKRELFYDRPGHLFIPIAQLYQTGLLHRGPGVCPRAIKEELYFWEIFPKYAHLCCEKCVRLRPKKKSHLVPSKKSKPSVREEDGGLPLGRSLVVPGKNGHVHFETEMKDHEVEVSFRHRFEAKYRKIALAIFESMDGLRENKLSLGITLVSIFFILLNLLFIVIDSLPGYNYSNYAEILVFSDVSDFKELHESAMDGLMDNHSLELTEELRGYHNFRVNSKITEFQCLFIYCLDWICTGVFTFELMVKVIFCPNIFTFLRQFTTIIDVLSVFPAYIEVLLRTLVKYSGQTLSALQVLRTLRTFRVFRILRLAKFQSSLAALGECITSSTSEFLLMFLHLSIAALLFGSLLYYVELAEEKTPFSTIPLAVYWATVTYFSFADVPPITTVGKVIALTSSIVGIILLALPVSVVVEKFSNHFKVLRREQRLKELAEVQKHKEDEDEEDD